MAGGKKLVGVGDMAGEIMGVLQEYGEFCASEMKEAAIEVAKGAEKELKKRSPEGEGSRKGHYKDGWTHSVGKDSAYSIGVTIHNKKKPGLTHLLENGHAKRGGGRVEGIRHIAPVEKQIEKEYAEKLAGRLSE